MAFAAGALWVAGTEATQAYRVPYEEPPRAVPGPGYKLVWSDEFDTGTMPDPAKWDYDIDRNEEGWWNSEAQYYAFARPENSRIENGNLIIEARP